MSVRASAWPQADALFRRDARWLGSDDAYSVELSPGRTLWLFGDTFVGDGKNSDRADAAFIRNSIAIMRGNDPSGASIRFVWNEVDGAPGSFFDAGGSSWLWPLDGMRAGEGLLLFFMLVRASVRGGSGGIEDWRTYGPLGFFDVYGWTAVLVHNPDDEPEHWRHSLVAPVEPSPIVLGAAAYSEGDFAYLYGWDAAKRIFVARMPAHSHDLSMLQWWCGDRWDSGGNPAAIAERGQTEFTVHRMGDRLCLTAVAGSAPASLTVRWARDPQGPWSEPQSAMTPEESLRADAMVYAGKAHPHLTGADLVTTYASNATVDVTLKDDSLYYPRFARIWPEGRA